MRSFLMVLFVAAGCSGDETTDSAKNTGDTGLATIETGDTGGGTTIFTTFDRSASLTGTVSDGDGVPLDATAIRFCWGNSCRFGSSEGGGGYTFDDVHVDWHSLEAIPPKGTVGLATAFAPVQFDVSEARSIDLYLPALDPSVALPATPEELEVGAGLFLTVGVDDLEPPLFFDPTTEIAGVQVPADRQVPVDLPGTVIAMWYLSPFDYHSDAGMPVRFANSWGLPDGNTYKVMLGSYEDQSWLDAGTVTVAGDWIEGDARLSLTSTVVLLEE